MPELTIAQRILQIEEEIRKTPYHKGTEHHIGKLKARAAKLKDEQIEKNAKSSGGGGGGGYAVKKTGDASVVFVGPPSVGKSTLLNKLTNANSKIAAYDFTTVNVIPGMMDYKKTKIQIFDVPGIIEGAASGKGRGKEVLSVARIADLIAIIVDNRTLDRVAKIKTELYENGVRLGEKRPNVSIIKQLSGGIKINSTTNLSLSHETIKGLAEEFRLPNAEIIIRENLSLDNLIDCFTKNRVYLPYLVIVNKIDSISNLSVVKKTLKDENFIAISAQNGINLEQLREEIWNKLDFIRIYFRKRDETDYDSPYIAKKGKNLSDLLARLTMENKEEIKFAKIFGPGAKYPGQEVSLSFVPQDETVVQFV